MATSKSLEYLNEGYTVIIDTDLEKFYDKVNHDKPLQILSLTIKDKDLISLIRKYLGSGVMVEGVLLNTDEGALQGGVCKTISILLKS